MSVRTAPSPSGFAFACVYCLHATSSHHMFFFLSIYSKTESECNSASSRVHSVNDETICNPLQNTKAACFEP